MPDIALSAPPMAAPLSRLPAIRLLIVTAFSTLQGFLLPMEHRTLVWGLDQANIRWVLYNPWMPSPDMSRFDAVLISVYRAHAYNFVYYAEKFERDMREKGVPVINTVAGSEGLHSFYLSRWREAGVPCARFQRFQTAEELTLDCYPLILRRDGVHRGATMLLAQNPRDAAEKIAAQHAESASTYPNMRGSLPVDMAIEFVATQAVEGYFCKWRAYAVGDEIIPAHFMRSLSPFVNYKDAALWSGTCSMDQSFQMEGEPHPERVRAAAGALGIDILAIDYGLRADGEYVFFEGNRVRATAGDAHVRWLGVRDSDLTFGAAVARLIRKRVDEALPRACRSVHRLPPARPPAAAFLRPAASRNSFNGRMPEAAADPGIIAGILAWLEPLRLAARRMEWPVLTARLANAALSLKGQPVTPAEVESLLRLRTRDIRDIEIELDQVIALSTTAPSADSPVAAPSADSPVAAPSAAGPVAAASADIHVRLAAVGDRHDGGGRGGLILEVKSRLARDDRNWRVEWLAVDCPPEWALWNSRPNDLAPRRYGPVAISPANAGTQ